MRKNENIQLIIQKHKNNDNDSKNVKILEMIKEKIYKKNKFQIIWSTDQWRKMEVYPTKNSFR